MGVPSFLSSPSSRTPFARKRLGAPSFSRGGRGAARRGALPSSGGVPAGQALLRCAAAQKARGRGCATGAAAARAPSTVEEPHAAEDEWRRRSAAREAERDVDMPAACAGLGGGARGCAPVSRCGREERQRARCAHPQRTPTAARPPDFRPSPPRARVMTVRHSGPAGCRARARVRAQRRAKRENRATRRERKKEAPVGFEPTWLKP